MRDIDFKLIIANTSEFGQEFTLCEYNYCTNKA